MIFQKRMVLVYTNTQKCILIMIQQHKMSQNPKLAAQWPIPRCVQAFMLNEPGKRMQQTSEKCKTHSVLQQGKGLKRPIGTVKKKLLQKSTNHLPRDSFAQSFASSADSWHPSPMAYQSCPGVKRFQGPVVVGHSPWTLVVEAEFWIFFGPLEPLSNSLSIFRGLQHLHLQSM